MIKTMKRDVQLPSVFADNNICTLDAYARRTRRVPPRTIGSHNFSTQLSAMTTVELDLRLDGVMHRFEEARNAVRYLGCGPDGPDLEHLDPPRVISIRRIFAHQSLTLLLIDDLTGKTIAVIGDALAWELDGLDVRLVAAHDDDVELARI